MTFSLLAVETSGPHCSVALAAGGEVRQRRVRAQRDHARTALALIEQLLAEGGLALGRLDALAYSRGPGSFTGLRIGFGIVQAMAFAWDLPLVGLSALEVLAARAADEQGVAGKVLAVLDARMGEVYAGVYRVAPGEPPLPLAADRIATPAELSAELPPDLAMGVGEGLSLCQLPAGVIALPDLWPDAATLARLALGRLERGEGVSAEAADLVYLRTETAWHKRPVGAGG
ncbi:MAG: tRNA (adenosine(37)-N6)-threonylcarbamoyltransferase complex dimerization subunit type 1 TsaB [Porticoccaceae bacterium]|nr:MAG: tRNA (adenosine(37)-N6)-threonylcarbamoyltransferase complex dimerization subunit type 1 TsaB [Porticoccaceae bacterium]